MAFNWVKFPWTNLHELNLDWIIQTVKTLEDNLADAVSTFKTMIDEAILNTLTGEGEFNVIKTGNVLINGKNVEISAGAVAEGNNSIKLPENGDVDINGKNVQINGTGVQLSRTAISGASEQLSLHNPTSSTSMTANYNSGVLTLSNNQESAKGVAVYPINTPADGGGDNSTFAANVGYVKASVEAVSTALATETGNRTSGDAALQSTIDNVIMPLLNKLGERAPRIIYASISDASQDTHTLTAEQIAPIKTALIEHTPIMLCVDSTADAQQFTYQLDNCIPVPNSGNIDGTLTLTFKTVSSGRTATLALNSGVITFT